MHPERLALCNVGSNHAPDDIFPRGRLTYIIPPHDKWCGPRSRAAFDGPRLHQWVMDVLEPGESVTYGRDIKLARSASMPRHVTGHVVQPQTVMMLYPGRITSFKVPSCLRGFKSSDLVRDDSRIAVKSRHEGQDWIEVFSSADAVDGEPDARTWRQVCKEDAHGLTDECPTILAYALVGVANHLDQVYEDYGDDFNPDYQALLKSVGVFRNTSAADCEDGNDRWQSWLCSVFRQSTHRQIATASGRLMVDSVFGHPLLARKGCLITTPPEVRAYYAKAVAQRDIKYATLQDRASRYMQLIQEGEALVQSLASRLTAPKPAAA